MRSTRIYVDRPLAVGEALRLPEAASQHVLRVLRLRVGEPLTLFNGRGGEYRALLKGAAKTGAVVEVLEHEPTERESPLPLTLLQGIARGERMDLIVQKATELGVSRIVPVLSAHAVVRLDSAQAARRVEHWRAVAQGACEQCGRNQPPQIEPLSELPAACGRDDLGAMRWVLHPTATRSLLDALRGSPAGDRPRPPATVALLIGPEGGLSSAELSLTQSAGFIPVHLGPRILRTETAPLAALAIVQALAGDLQHRGQ